MKLIAALNGADAVLETLAHPACDGVLFDPFRFAEEDFLKLKEAAQGKELQCDLRIMLEEEEIPGMRYYLQQLKELDPDGIVFTDLGLFKLAKEAGLTEKMIYDGGPLLSNTLDAAFFLKEGCRSVILARELTLEEVKTISKTLPAVSMQTAGYLCMSSSKRKYLSSYFAYRDLPEDPWAEGYTIREERREEEYPIKEGRNGTKIYTESVFLPFREWKELNVQYGYLEGELFKKEEILSLLDVCQLLKEGKETEAQETASTKLPQKSFFDGYLYRRSEVR